MQAVEVIVGERGKVTGMVAGEQVVVRGKVSGVVCAKNVALQASSDVQGDIHHMSFAIEQGAVLKDEAVAPPTRQLSTRWSKERVLP